MRSNNLQKVLVVAGLFGASSVLGVVQPTLAQSRSDVREERRDVRQTRERVRDQRQDVREADSARARREEQAALAKKQQKLRQEQAELQRARQQRLEQQRLQQRRDYNGRYNRRNTYNRNNLSIMEGVVSNDTINNRTFRMRISDGGQITVQLQGGVPGRISPGDRVRVYGQAVNGVFRAQNLTILRNR
jgi:translation initiation factor IF-1